MSGGHDHSHDEGTGNRRRLLIALGITTTILIVEAIGAWVSGSLALLADAGHMLTDAAGLLIAAIAATLATRPATDQRTWGYRRAEVLAATLQAAVLLAVGVFVLVEGIRRLIEPPEVASGAMVVFGIIGLLGNAASIYVLSRGRGANLNVRAAFLEVVNDALGSAAVLIAATVIATTGWLRADALVSLLIGVLILPRTIRLLRETTEVLLEVTPRGLDLAAVRQHLLGLPHVHAVHDLHASQITTGLPVLSAHVVIDDSCFLDGHAPQLLDRLQSCVAEHFAISVEHSTFQLEPLCHAGHEAPTHS
ncbi:cobalt-zinc-cadmium efflux system protein [Modestobacter sp. DSM 44400]|uniref:cation diffusion facilitator family transporter n=1 Tax=Modestobacter sp. DSM 44400 TaxID=1550230 RepID=UPI0008946AD5|nr:cation diffusion facilitator family transporter [Modestobacter sp. DSM 44400]SDX60030.1 cobalt-zinc-cadmium efflux system protein [Modestobacter sp. DSM 44400]